MTVDDFRAVARVLFVYRPSPADKSAFKVWQSVVEGLAIEFYVSSPRFDRVRYFAATGFNPTPAEIAAAG